MSRWFRWYEGTSEDGKFRTVARNAKVTVATVMGVWAILLEDASHPDHRGIATRGEDFWGSVLDLDETLLITILSAMEGVNLISVGHGAITITKWKERQFETDTTDATNAERQRRWREKHKQDAGKTERNDSVTAEKRPDTDTDTDTEKKDIPRAKRADREKEADEFEEWYQAYPRHKARGDAFKAYRSVRKSIDAETLLTGAKAAARKYAGSDQQFTPYPASWLRGEQWRDEDLQPAPERPVVSNGQVYVKYGTDPGDAWEAKYRLKGKIPPRDQGGGWYFPTEYPDENGQEKAA